MASGGTRTPSPRPRGASTAVETGVIYYCRYVTIYKVCTGEGRGVLDSLERMYKYPVARGAAVFSVVAPTFRV